MMTVMTNGSVSSDGCYKENMKGGSPPSTGSNNGGNSLTGCINRPLHFNSHKNDRNSMEGAVFKLIHSFYCLSLVLPHCMVACLLFSVRMILLERFVGHLY